jgi:SAM-dependent methyltransferase
MNDSVYDQGFYDDQSPGSQRSAAAVLPVLFELVPCRSIVDVGCGIGTWLAEAMRLGVDDVLGIDGSHVDPSRLLIPSSSFTPADLGQPLPPTGRTFDVAICLEVAEHLPAERAASFVSDLAALAPVVVFSAAVPGQGGTNHVNEQWQSYWTTKFAEVGFASFDVLRPRVWNDRDVETWYRQNTLVYVDRRDSAMVDRLTALTSAGPIIEDVVHPDLLAFYVRRATRRLSTVQAARATVDAAAAAFRRRVPGRRR